MISVTNPRQVAFNALRDLDRKQVYTDIALDRVLRQTNFSNVDRGLVSELVYGIVRRKRSLDALIDLLGKKKARQQPPNLRIILHIGLYQLRYLSQIPESAAVNTTVELAKANGLSKLAGVVNGLLREYVRQAVRADPLLLPENPVERLGILHSLPNWIVEIWLKQLPFEEVNQLCAWFNQSPTTDLRVNVLKTSVEALETVLVDAGISVTRLPHLPQALRLTGSFGQIKQLPGYREGWWIVQDSSAQLVTHLLDPQPGETVIDACAAPGGKTTHIAELMKDKGIIWACDRAPNRLQKVRENAERLQLSSIKICAGDIRKLTQFKEKGDPAGICEADRVLLDAPCSGLGTIHKRPDIRWRQTSEKIRELSLLQRELLKQAATWVKPGGILVYATCTLNPQENEEVIQSFLETYSNWAIEPPLPSSPAYSFKTSESWIKIFPHQHHMDGFFMVKLRKSS
ncbi:16S rRNA (cytosine(967)-C(5))-methyltransferase [Pleurocapsales cyanobacterium LEGE 06147]|nr:16S rRNA (cytosine(967)-C(5))-methyltransferase [Pleurocapsales cyanobacterium LEGE 06147]